MSVDDCASSRSEQAEHFRETVKYLCYLQTAALSKKNNSHLIFEGVKWLAEIVVQVVLRGELGIQGELKVLCCGCERSGCVPVLPIEILDGYGICGKLLSDQRLQP